MKVETFNRLGNAGFIALYGLLFGPPVGGFIFGVCFSVYLLFAAFFLGHGLNEVVPANRFGSFGESIAVTLSFPFLFALTAYIPGAPTAVLTGITTGVYIFAKGKISRSVILFCTVFSSISIIFMYFVIDGNQNMSVFLFASSAAFCALSVISADIVYRTFGRHMSIQNDIEVRHERALLDKIRKPSA